MDLDKPVDKRYVEKFHIFSESYGECVQYLHGSKLESETFDKWLDFVKFVYSEI